MRSSAKNWIRLAFASALLALPVPASADESRDRPDPQVTTAPQRVTVGQIAASPERFFGEEVQVRAEIQSVTNRHIFTLEGSEPGVDPDVLVFVPNPGVPLARPHPDLRGAFAARPVIVGRSVRAFDGHELERSAR